MANIENEQKVSMETPEKPKNFIDKFIDVISGIFIPILSVLIATGMIKGFTALLIALSVIDANSGTNQILQIIGDCFFYFFPIFLGISAARKFNMNEFTGVAVGAALVYPSLATIMQGETLYTLFEGTLLSSEVKMEFMGLPVILMNYASSVVPIIVSLYFGAKIEHAIDKRMPELVKGFMTPFVSLLIIIPLTFLVIGPIATWAGNAVGTAAISIFNFSPVLAGLFIGGFWQVIVIFGLHWWLIPIMIQNIATNGFDPVIITYFAASFAQTGTAFAIMLKTKDIKLKTIAAPACIAGIFGITEPIVYGVTLPRKKYFVIACIAAAIGGAIIAYTGAYLYIFAGFGLFSIPGFINPATNDMSGMYYGVIASAVAFAIAAAVSFVLFKDE